MRFPEVGVRWSVPSTPFLFMKGYTMKKHVDHRAFICVPPGQSIEDYLEAHPELEGCGAIILSHPQAWRMMLEYTNFTLYHIAPNQAGSVLCAQMLVDAIQPPPLDTSAPPKDPAIPDWHIERGNLN